MLHNKTGWKRFLLELRKTDESDSRPGISTVFTSFVLSVKEGPEGVCPDVNTCFHLNLCGHNTKPITVCLYAHLHPLENMLPIFLGFGLCAQHQLME